MANPWAPMYWGDLLKKTSQLTCQQFGVYMRLLGYYYTNEEAPPANADALHRICIALAKGEQDDVQVVTDKFFDEHEGSFHNKRADEELAKARDISTKRVKAAILSHANRVQKSSKRHAKRPANGVQMHTQPQPQLQPQPQRPLQPPLKSTEGGSSSIAAANDQQLAGNEKQLPNLPPIDDLPIHAVAAGMIENLRIPKTAQLLDIVAQAIRIVAEREKCDTIKGAEFLHHAASCALRDNIRVNRFWFEDQKYDDYLGAPHRGNCAKHPDSGLTQRGNCYGCYVEANGQPEGATA